MNMENEYENWISKLEKWLPKIFWHDHTFGKCLSYTFKEAWKGDMKVDGCTVSDIDFILNSYFNHEILFMEQKNMNKTLGHAQIQTFGLIDKIMSEQNYRDYKGYWLITFEKENWFDGDVTLEKLNFKCKEGIPGLRGIEFQLLESTNEQKITKEQFQQFIYKHGGSITMDGIRKK